MVAPMGKRLSAEDWEAAALAAIVEGGLGAVAVEPLARRLGVTKGSFYWHFANREALIHAAIARWERNQLAALQAPVSVDPVEDFQDLVHKALNLVGQPTIQRRLTAEADRDTHVAAALARVTHARVHRIASLYRRTGLSPTHARARAAVVYATIIGLEQIDREGELNVSESALRRELLAMLR
jgi:AcrR family transcriptional regulator